MTGWDDPAADPLGDLARWIADFAAQGPTPTAPVVVHLALSTVDTARTAGRDLVAELDGLARRAGYPGAIVTTGCPKCGGSGRFPAVPIPGRAAGTCWACHGSGRIPLTGEPTGPRRARRALEKARHSLALPSPTEPTDRT